MQLKNNEIVHEDDRFFLGLSYDYIVCCPIEYKDKFIEKGRFAMYPERLFEMYIETFKKNWSHKPSQLIKSKLQHRYQVCIKEITRLLVQVDEFSLERDKIERLLNGY